MAMQHVPVPIRPRRYPFLFRDQATTCPLHPLTCCSQEMLDTFLRLALSELSDANGYLVRL
jgi:hypothetical protein